MHSSSFLFIRDDGGGVDYLPIICLVLKCSGVPCLMTSKKETAIVLLLDSLEIIDLFFGGRHFHLFLSLQKIKALASSPLVPTKHIV